MSGGAGEPELGVRKVSKWLGPRSGPPALRDVSLEIPRGSFTVIAGASGSGKTTLLSLLGFLDRPTEGQVFFQGRDLTHSSGRALALVRRKIGFVFQDCGLISRLALWENVSYPLIPRGVGDRDRFERARAALQELGLEDFLLKTPEELSGGERQRAAVARVVATAPEVVLADEPTSNLDPEASAALRGSLAALHTAGATVVVVTHDPDFVALAQRRVLLRRGVLEDDSSC